MPLGACFWRVARTSLTLAVGGHDDLHLVDQTVAVRELPARLRLVERKHVRAAETLGVLPNFATPTSENSRGPDGSCTLTLVAELEVEVLEGDLVERDFSPDPARRPSATVKRVQLFGSGPHVNPSVGGPLFGTCFPFGSMSAGMMRLHRALGVCDPGTCLTRSTACCGQRSAFDASRARVEAALGPHDQINVLVGFAEDGCGTVCLIVSLNTNDDTTKDDAKDDGQRRHHEATLVVADVAQAELEHQARNFFMRSSTFVGVGLAISSTIWPSSRNNTRSAYDAAMASWVTITIVWSNSVVAPRRNSRISADVAESRLPVGSSAKTMWGRFGKRPRHSDALLLAARTTRGADA